MDVFDVDMEIFKANMAADQIDMINMTANAVSDVFTLETHDEVLRALARRGLADEAAAVVATVAEEAATMAANAAPRRTGALAASIHALMTGNVPNPGAGVVPPSADAAYATVEAAEPYAGYVEFGTVKSPAQPFFTPAIRWAQIELVARLKRLLEHGA